VSLVGDLCRSTIAFDVADLRGAVNVDDVQCEDRFGSVHLELTPDGSELLWRTSRPLIAPVKIAVRRMSAYYRNASSTGCHGLTKLNCIIAVGETQYDADIKSYTTPHSFPVTRKTQAKKQPL